MSGSFSVDLSRFCKKYDADIKVVIKKIAFEAFKRIILRTPVDTGRARANWGVSVGKPIQFLIEGEDKSGSATLTAASDGTMLWDCTGSIFLTNNVSYIGILEYGREDGKPGSNQAPNGMVRVTMEEMIAWVRSVTNVKETISSIRDTTGGH